MLKRLASGAIAISVFLGWAQVSQAATASFQASASFDAGVDTPAAVVTDDVNGDGSPDIVTVDSASNTGSVLLGNGDGTLQAPLSFTVDGSSHLAHSLAVGDFNDDGKSDIVVANADITGISVLLGKGDGTFQTTVRYSTGDYTCPPPSLGSPYQPKIDTVTVADLNGDGKLDILMIPSPILDINCPSDYFGIFLGNGDGTFQTPTYFDYGYIGTPFVFATGDLNGDNILDIVSAFLGTSPVLGATGQAMIGTGSAVYQSKNISSFGFSIQVPTDMAISDFNGDGNSDIVSTDANMGSVGVLLGNGDGTFGSPVVFDLGALPMSLSVADIDGDGNLDILTANQQLVSSDNIGLVVNMLAGNGDGTFQPRQAITVTGPTDNVTILVEATTMDLNTDGIPDIAVAGYGADSSLGKIVGSINIVLGIGNGSSSSPSSPSDSTQDTNTDSSNSNTDSASTDSGGGGGGALGLNIFAFLALYILLFCKRVQNFGRNR